MRKLQRQQRHDLDGRSGLAAANDARACAGLCGTADLEARRRVEDRFSAKSPAFVPSYALFFPGREFDDDEVQATLDEHAIDAVLILEGGEEGVNTSTWTSPTQSYASASCPGGGSSVNCTGRETTTGGQTYTFTKPWATYTVRLYDRRTGQTAWVASGEVKGKAIATMGQMREMAVREDDRTARGGRRDSMTALVWVVLIGGVLVLVGGLRLLGAVLGILLLLGVAGGVYIWQTNEDEAEAQRRRNESVRIEWVPGQAVTNRLGDCHRCKP